MNAKKLAIVGAGAAGLATAWKLKQLGSPIEVTIFEKSRGVSGRATSRTRHGVRLDPGANYLKAEPAEIADLLKRHLPSEDLIEIPGDVCTFNWKNQIIPGDPKLNAEPKFTYRGGISQFGKLLLEASEAKLVRQTRIEKLGRSNDTWQLVADSGEQFGDFDAVMLTAPAPQSVAILEQSSLGGSTKPLIEALELAEYHQQFCFALAYEGILPRPLPCFALLNSDRKHSIAWLSFQNDKVGHVPDGLTVVMVQMQPAWSKRRFHDDPEVLAGQAAEEVADLLGWRHESPVWFDSQRWMFAHPYSAVEDGAHESAEGIGLFVAGDALVGKGRANLALETGLRCAERIARSEI